MKACDVLLLTRIQHSLTMSSHMHYRRPAHDSTERLDALIIGSCRYIRREPRYHPEHSRATMALQQC